MGEFEKLGKLLEQYHWPSIRCSKVPNRDGKWTVEVYSEFGEEIRHEEHRLDTALTLVLQDLRDMANE